MPGDCSFSIVVCEISRLIPSGLKMEGEEGQKITYSASHKSSGHTDLPLVDPQPACHRITLTVIFSSHITLY